MFYDITSIEYVSFSSVNSTLWTGTTSITEKNTSVGPGFGTQSELEAVGLTGTENGVRISNGAGASVFNITEPVEIITVTLRVKDGAVGGDYSIKCLGQNKSTSGYVLSLVTVSTSIITIGGTAAPTYTATPSSSDATGVKAGDTFNVAVDLTADVGAEYAQAQVKLAYLADLVTPDLADLENVSGSDGLLTITAGNGTNVAVGNGVLLATIPFTAVGAGNATFSVSEGASLSFVTLEGSTKYDITAGADLTVAIAEADPSVTFTYDDNYQGLPEGYTLLKYQIDGADAGNVWTYGEGGPAMHLVKTGANYYVTYIVEESAAPITPVITSANYIVSANIDGVGAVDICDSQIAFDLANGYAGYATADSLTTLTITQRLAADVNGDGEVTVTDAQAIIYAIHHNGQLAD